MIALAVALWLSPAPAQPPPQAPFGRILTTPTVHVGIRPHLLATPDEKAFAVTFQVTAAVL